MLGWPAGTTATVRDLWAKTDVVSKDRFPAKEYQSVEAHSTLLQLDLSCGKLPQFVYVFFIIFQGISYLQAFSVLIFFCRRNLHPSVTTCLCFFLLCLSTSQIVLFVGIGHAHYALFESKVEGFGVLSLCSFVLHVFIGLGP